MNGICRAQSSKDRDRLPSWERPEKKKANIRVKSQITIIVLNEELYSVIVADQLLEFFPDHENQF